MTTLDTTKNISYLHICEVIYINNCIILYFVITDKNTTPFYFLCRIIEGGCKRNIKMRGLEAYMSQTSANMLIRACIVKKEPALLVSIIHV